MKNDCISVSNSETFATIDKAFEKVFSSKKPQPMKGCFKPLPSFAGTKLAECHIWFPKLKRKGDGWKNQLVNNGEEITSKSDSVKGKAQVGQKNITFANAGNGYAFAGIFELDKIDADGTEHWKKIADECQIIGRSK